MRQAKLVKIFGCFGQSSGKFHKLRAGSIHGRIGRRLGRIRVYEGLATHPHYSPELDTPDVPEAVQDWRRRLASADGVAICTPEYAFGMPGSLKNALDWVVSSGELLRKPVAALSASP